MLFVLSRFLMLRPAVLMGMWLLGGVWVAV
jgi:hypothetical protein